LYQQTFSRSTPGCIVILLDRSESMQQRWAGSELTLAHGAARAINKIFLELCIKSTKEQGGDIRHYFDVGVFGYGLCASTGTTEGVESALGGALAGRGIVSLPELANNPMVVREEPSIDTMATSSRVPIWIEPVSGYRTPMCQAIALAGAHIYDWVTVHPNSFPPIVVNITDGFVTDSPHNNEDLNGWARRLCDIHTADGPTLLLNIFLSQSQSAGVWFPSSPHSLHEPGPDLFAISSPLPQPMIDNARSAHVTVEPGARGLVFNADLAMLVKFLEIGTRFDVRDC
jgi:hypothetical protein